MGPTFRTYDTKAGSKAAKVLRSNRGAPTNPLIQKATPPSRHPQQREPRLPDPLNRLLARRRSPNQSPAVILRRVSKQLYGPSYRRGMALSDLKLTQLQRHVSTLQGEQIREQIAELRKQTINSTLVERITSFADSKAEIDQGELAGNLGRSARLYVQADDLRKIMTMYPEKRRSNVLTVMEAELRGSGKQLWSGASRQTFAANSDVFYNYLRAVYEYVDEIWPHLTEDAAKVNLLKTVLAHDKGYDVCQKTVTDRRMQTLMGGGVRAAVGIWLQNVPNTSPINNQPFAPTDPLFGRTNQEVIEAQYNEGNVKKREFWGAFVSSCLVEHSVINNNSDQPAINKVIEPIAVTLEEVYGNNAPIATDARNYLQNVTALYELTSSSSSGGSSPSPSSSSESGSGVQSDSDGSGSDKGND